MAKRGTALEATLKMGTSGTGRNLSPWLLSVWTSVTLLPNARIFGFPLRVEDAIIGASLLFLLVLIPSRGHVPTLTALEVILLVTAAYIAIVTALGSPNPYLTVGLKEYVDVARPLKFFALIFIARRIDYDSALFTITRCLPVLAVVVASITLMQLAVSILASGHPFLRGFLVFTDLDDAEALRMMSFRPFGTFHTPTDLGYFSAIVIFVAIFMPGIKSRATTAVTGTLGLVLSATRTFLFSVPFLLALMTWWSYRGILRKIKAMLVVVVVMLLGVGLFFFLLPKVSPASAQFATNTVSVLISGEYERDPSVAERLKKWDLVTTTAQTALWTGMISRDLLGAAADSEYIMTFHRYGVLGLFLTLALYIQAWVSAGRGPMGTRRLVRTVIVLTFLYGVTQGALISTRVGCFFFLFLSLQLANRRRDELRLHRQRRGPAGHAHSEGR